MFKLAVIPILGLLMLSAPKFSTFSNFALEIDGKSAGSIKGVEGGSTQKEVKLELGIGPGKELQDWVNLAFANKPVPKTAIAHACNQKFESMVVQELEDAHITEVRFPALDASSREPAYLTVKIAPQRVSYTKGSGKVVSPRSKEQPSRFSLDIPGLPSARVSKVESFSWKVSTKEHSTVSDLKIHVPSTDLPSWRRAAKAKRRIAKGVLTLSTPDHVCKVDLHGMTVKAVSPTADRAPTFPAELAVESLTLDCRPNG
jgi:hypothetical protein